MFERSTLLERGRLLGIYLIHALVPLFLWMLACVCAVCVLFVLNFYSLERGNVSTLPKESSLTCILDKCSDYSHEPMSERKMIKEDILLNPCVAVVAVKISQPHRAPQMKKCRYESGTY